jgi:hypothetical protein
MQEGLLFGFRLWFGGRLGNRFRFRSGDDGERRRVGNLRRFRFRLGWRSHGQRHGLGFRGSGAGGRFGFITLTHLLHGQRGQAGQIVVGRGSGS